VNPDNDFGNKLVSCSLLCLMDNTVGCYKKCLSSVKLSDPCETCHASFLVCGAKNCAGMCFPNSTVPACVQCLTKFECLPNLVDCTAITKLPPGGVAPIEGNVIAKDFPKVQCPEGLSPYAVLEPNDSEETAWELLDPVAAPGFCLSGATLCGNYQGTYKSDSDYVKLTFSKGAKVLFQMDWLNNSDMDFILYEEGNGTALIDFTDGTAENEKGSWDVEAGKTYYLQMACWSGTSGGWAMWGKF
jgi:hypothetical protein